MTDPVTTAAGSALVELLEVSPQVDAAVILERDGGSVVASAPDSAARMADRLGTTCMRIIDAAEQSRRELGREPVSQVEVGTPDGHVFVVGDATWLVAAVTDADPTVGLVFYDLKTALRAVREAATSSGDDASSSTASNSTSNGDAPVTLVTSTGDSGEETATGDDSSEASSDSAPGSSNRANQRWRRRNK